MIVEKARVALEKLRRTNYKQIPDFGMDNITEQILSIIANECKSTTMGEDGIRRYESDIVRDNIDAIIRQLVLNGSYIPKETMNKIIHFNGRVIGVNSDISIYKGIDNETGEIIATISKPTINICELNKDVLTSIENQIYSIYARQLILNNSKQFPKQKTFLMFKEKLLHGREDREFIAKKYIDLLREKTSYSDEIIRNTVEYNLDYMYDENFKKEVIRSIREGQSIVSVDQKRKGF